MINEMMNIPKPLKFITVISLLLLFIGISSLIIIPNVTIGNHSMNWNWGIDLNVPKLNGKRAETDKVRN
jgi:hypothetical protein